MRSAFLVPLLAFPWLVASGLEAGSGATPGQTRFLRALEEGVSPAILLSEVDALVREEPGCETASFLLEHLPRLSGERRALLRLARLLGRLDCAPKEDILRREILRLADGLGARSDIEQILVQRKPPPPMPQTTPDPGMRFHLQTGFRFASPLRAVLSPSGRYLAVGALKGDAALSVWDLETGDSVAEFFTASPLAAFLDDRSVLYSNFGQIRLLDLSSGQDSREIAMLSFLPSFLVLEPSGRRLAFNDQEGDVTLASVRRDATAGSRIQKLGTIQDLRAQSALFIADGRLLLGTSAGDLLLVDSESSAILESLTLPQENIKLEVRGDLLYGIFRTLGEIGPGVRSIVSSADGRRIAALSDGRIALLERDGDRLRLQRVLVGGKPFESIAFVGDRMLAISAQKLFLFDIKAEMLVELSLPEGLRELSDLLALDDSRLLVLGPRLLAIYDPERSTVIRLQDGSGDSPFSLSVRLFDAEGLYFYSPESGLRRTAFSRLRDALDGTAKVPIFELIYRSGMTGDPPAPLLGSFDRYGGVIYWLEKGLKQEDGPAYLYYRAPGPLSRPPRIRFTQLPESFEAIPSSNLSQEVLDRRVRDFRSLREDYRVQVDMEGVSREVIPDIFLALRNRGRVACNGEVAAFGDREGLAVLGLNDSRLRYLAPDAELARLAFHPSDPVHLVVAGRQGRAEIWDIREERRLQTVELPGTAPVDLLSLDRSGRYAAIARRDRLLLWDLVAGQIRLDLPIAPGRRIYALAFDPESTRLAAGSSGLDGSELMVVELASMTARSLAAEMPFGFFGDLAFWRDAHHILEVNPQTLGLTLYQIKENKLELRLRLLLLEDGEAIIHDPAGRYWSTLEGERYLTWQRGLEVSRAPQLYRAYRSPEWIQELLLGHESAPLERPSAPVPPRVEVLSPSLPRLGVSLPVSEKLELRVRLTGRRPIESLAVLVDGVRQQTLPVQATSAVLSLTVGRLTSGLHQVALVAVDDQGTLSRPRAYPVYVESSNIELPRLAFLGIAAPGTQGAAQLRYVRQDAELLASRFAAIPAGHLWRRVTAEILAEEEISPAGVEQALTRIGASLVPEDLLVLYLAGHSSGEGLAMKTGTLLWSDLALWLGRLRGRVLVLVDACKSGALLENQVDAGGALSSLLTAREAGVALLAASRSWRDTYEFDRLGHGIFALALAAAFSAPADANGDGLISLFELRDTAQREAHALSWQEYEAEMRSWRKALAAGPAPDEGLDEAYSRIIQLPHVPWVPRLEEFGDILLFPIQAGEDRSRSRSETHLPD